MTITKTAENEDQKVCDGCGRSDAGPDSPMMIAPYSVHDPNTNSDAEHHYCGSCARNRGLTDTLSTVIPGWHPVMPPTIGPGETPAEHEAAMRGESTSENNGIALKFADAVGNETTVSVTRVPDEEVPEEAEGDDAKE
jgi:hypothetical protein